ncbi:type II secretion system protein GspM [Massilia sp. W12]|uniref:type II secretion system protein GspM n=1 Tax=Massilia sp. W12 TaxID=3126507 RepID=UPI0030D06A69
MNALKQAFDNFWSVRTEQEQKLLKGLGAFAAFALLYLVAIDPALSNRPKLEKELPQLKMQAAQIQALVQEAQALKQRAAAGSAPLSKEMIEASLTQAGLSAKTVGMLGEQVKLQLNEAQFGNVVAWLDGLQKSAHVSVIDANIVAQGAPGMVVATLSLYQPK